MTKTICVLLLVTGLAFGQSSKYQSIHKGPKIDSSLTDAINTKIYNPKSYGAVGNGIAADRIPIQLALNAASTTKGKVVFPSGGIFLVDDTLLVSGNNVTIEGSDAIIRQTTAGKKIFRVEGSNVVFRNLTIVGDTNSIYDSSYAPNNTYDVGIDFAVGTSNQFVDRCDLSLLKVGIFARRVDGLTVRNSYIHDVWAGVVGGYALQADQSNQDAVYLIEGNRIHCAFGTLTTSRPIALPFATSYRISNNELRGGGMAIESLTSSAADVTQSSRIISGNNCDAAISAGNNVVISGNTLDTRYAPVGRGPQDNFAQAIEGGYYSTISNNIIRHFRAGYAYSNFRGRIIGNFFDTCGDSVAGRVNGIIEITTYIPGTNDTSGVIISGNTFVNSVQADIGLNWGQSDTLYDVTITNNFSFNARQAFILAGNVRGLTVTGNYIRDCWRSDTTNNTFGVWETNTMSSYYDANTFINTSATTGMYEAMSCTDGTVIGFTRVKGMRSGVPFQMTASTSVIGQTEVDGVLASIGTSAMGSLTIDGDLVVRRAIYNPVLYLDATDTTKDGTIVFQKNATNKWEIQNYGNNLIFYDFQGTPGIRATWEHTTGNVTFTGDLTSANGVTLTKGHYAFAASTRVAIYFAGMEAGDLISVSWDLTSDTGTLNGGNIWAYAKTDSAIVRCTNTSSEQFTLLSPK